MIVIIPTGNHCRHRVRRRRVVDTRFCFLYSFLLYYHLGNRYLLYRFYRKTSNGSSLGDRVRRCSHYKYTDAANGIRRVNFAVVVPNSVRPRLDIRIMLYILYTRLYTCLYYTVHVWTRNKNRTLTFFTRPEAIELQQYIGTRIIGTV